MQSNHKLSLLKDPERTFWPLPVSFSNCHFISFYIPLCISVFLFILLSLNLFLSFFPFLTLLINSFILIHLHTNGLFKFESIFILYKRLWEDLVPQKSSIILYFRQTNPKTKFGLDWEQQNEMNFNLLISLVLITL